MIWTPPRLYAILDTELTAARGLDPAEVAAHWLEAGVRLIQLRAKSLAFGPMLALADALVGLASQAAATIIVNDRADVARLAGADGVHLGQGDLAVADARVVLGVRALVGRSTHSPAQVRGACREPVSYVAIGPAFATTTKPNPDPEVGLSGVTEAAAICSGADLAVVAIGGITLERAPEVLAAGATSVAVISDLLVGDPGERAREWLDAVAASRMG